MSKKDPNKLMQSLYTTPAMLQCPSPSNVSCYKYTYVISQWSLPYRKGRFGTPSLPSDDSARDKSRSGDGASTSSIPSEESRAVSQELITAAVMDALSNPNVIRKIVAAVSPCTGEGSGTSSSVSVTDGKSYQ